MRAVFLQRENAHSKAETKKGRGSDQSFVVVLAGLCLKKLRGNLSAITTIFGQIKYYALSCRYLNQACVIK